MAIRLAEPEPLKIKIASRQEYKADFLLALYRSQREGLFFVTAGVGKLYDLSRRASIPGKELDVYSVVLAV